MSIFIPNTNNDFKIAIKYYFKDNCLNNNSIDISIIDFSGIGRTKNNVGRTDDVDNSNAISNWNIQNITDLSFTFQERDFNQNISQWDVSKVTTMESM